MMIKFGRIKPADALSLVAIVISVCALYLSWRQSSSDFDASVVLQSNVLPVTSVTLGKNEIQIAVQNTSKTNVRYFLRARSNMGTVDGPRGRPLMASLGYDSQHITLAKSELNGDSFTHSLVLDASGDPPDMNVLRRVGPADWFLLIEVVDAGTGKPLFSSQCYYSYSADDKAFVLHQPILATGDETARRRDGCRS